jgi:hypothetical protein
MYLKEHVRKHGAVHSVWMITVLLLVILVLVFRDPDSDRLGTIIGFAASAVSLVLALVAIGYSFVSNQSFSEVVGVLRSSTENIQTAAQNIVESSAALSGQSEVLVGHAEKMPTVVAELSAKLDEKVFSQSNSVSSRVDDDVEKAKTGYSQSRFGGQLALYAIAMAYKNESVIDPKAIFPEPAQHTWASILVGFILCVMAFKPCEVYLEPVAAEGGNSARYRVKSIGSLDHIDIIKMFSAYDDKDGNKERLAVDNYFDAAL